MPNALARTADVSISVFELVAPLARRDQVVVYASWVVRGDNLPAVCQEFRDRHPDDEFFIISNKVSRLTETMTRGAARDLNDLIGRNVRQAVTWMTPEEYEKLQDMNAWTGRSDLVLLR